MEPAANEVLLFTDGACSGNPGPGGWGFILRWRADQREERASGAERHTTNNRMELMSVIRGLQMLQEPSQVTIVTDSNYVAKGIAEWMPNWKKNGWRRKVSGRLKPIENAEYWQQLDELLQPHHVTCQWVRGHAGHPENEECDQMAVQAYLKLMQQ